MKMTYSRATEILGYTTPKSLKANADLARTRQSVMTAKTPLRYKVACSVLIEAA